MTEAAATMTVGDELAMLEEQVREGAAPRGAKARIRRLRELLDREVLGPLFRLFASYEFRDGVLFRAQLRYRSNRSRDLAEAIAAPRWGTIRELDLHGRPLEPLTPDSLFDSLPSLETLHGLGSRSLPAIPRPSIVELQLTSDVDPVALATRFPSLRRLHVEKVFNTRSFWSHRFMHGLDFVSTGPLRWQRGTLSVDNCYGLDHLTELIELGPQLERMELFEDSLFAGREPWRLYEVLDVARRRGAEIVIVPRDSDGPSWGWN